MRSTVEPLEGNKVKVSVEVDASEFEPAVEAAFRKLAKEVRIPGFRPGKAPRKILESRFGAEVGREQALQDSLPDFYARALAENDVDAIAAPEIDITSGHEDGPVAFDAVVEVRPTVSVGGYQNLRVTLERPEATDEEITAQLDRMREVDATLEPTDRPAAPGDTVTIDISGTLDGEEQPGLTADDYSYAVGSGAITPEVDEQLAGAKAGDILEFDATHPDPDETRELRFRVLVKDVQQKVLPELDDQWAAQASEFETLDELRASLADRMTNVRRAQAQMNLRERVGEALAKLVDEELPEALISHEMQHRLQDLAVRLQAQGLTLEQYLSMSGTDPEAFSQDLRTTATTAAKVDLALRAVADAEGIEVTEEQLEDELATVAERVGEPVDAVRQQFERGGQLSAVRSDLRQRAALEWLLERVEIVDPEGATIDRSELELPTEDATDGTDAPPSAHEHAEPTADAEPSGEDE